MRVVADPAAADRRRGNATTIDGSAETVAAGTALATAGGAASAAGKGLPLLPVALFLLACAAGGALVAVIRPLGLG